MAGRFLNFAIKLTINNFVYPFWIYIFAETKLI